MPPGHLGRATRRSSCVIFCRIPWRRGNFQYDRFGDYRRYPLGRMIEAETPIRNLQTALKKIDTLIAERSRVRMVRYDFLRPSKGPNSINI